VSKKNIVNHLTGVQKLFEVGVIFSFFAAIFISISLLSFSSVDPSWSQFQWVSEINNAGGAAGAWIADLLFYLFGHVAYFVPFVIVFLGWTLCWKPQLQLDIDFLNVSLRIIGFISTLLSMTTIASLNFNDFHCYPSGGIIGDIVGKSMLVLFSLLAVNLIALTLFVCGITLLMGFSWIRLIDGLGANVITAFSEFARLVIKFKDWYQGSKPLKRTAVQSRLEQDKQVSGSLESTSSVVQPKTLDHDSEIGLGGEQDTAILNFDSAPEAYEHAPFEIEDAKDEDANDQVLVQEQIEEEPKIDFSHLPEHARPVIKRKRDKNMAPFPSIDLLDKPNKKFDPISQEDLDNAARLVESKLLEFKIKAKVVNVLPGPVITRFELALSPGMKVSTVTGLEKDLARALSAMSVRVVDQIPGKSVIALELPNKHREIVFSSEVLGSKMCKDAKSPLSMVLGADISGKPVVVDLGKMPHLLVAGTTGSGKSVGVNCMLVSLLYKSAPEDVRLILIDPKMLELSVYEGIPHLLTEVVTDMKDAANALRWCVGEMERRYKLLSAVGVRTLAGYNKEVKEAKKAGTPLTDPLWKAGDSMDATAPELQKLPNIVVVVDEFADMMMIVGKKCEELITRIAQKARAAGIHLILATQRPSVDVITGLIKANIPTRIAFQVSSKIDSRTILGQQGAETLLGHGDMLYNVVYAAWGWCPYTCTRGFC